MDLHPPFEFKLNYRLDKKNSDDKFWLIASIRCGRHYALEGWSGQVNFPALLTWLRSLVVQRLPVDFFWIGAAGGAHFTARPLGADSPNVRLEITPENASPVIEATVPRLEVVAAILRALYAYSHALEAAGIEEPSGLKSADILAFEPLIKNPPPPPAAAPLEPLRFVVKQASLAWELHGRQVASWDPDSPAVFWTRWFAFLREVANLRLPMTVASFEFLDPHFPEPPPQVWAGPVRPVDNRPRGPGDVVTAEMRTSDTVHLKLTRRDWHLDSVELVSETLDRRALIASFCDAFEQSFLEWERLQPAGPTRLYLIDPGLLGLDELKRFVSGRARPPSVFG